MSEECVVLKNINYQTILLNSDNKIDSNKDNTPNIDVMLENEKNENKKKTWSKLGKASKIKKINEYVNEFSPKSKREQLQKFLIKSLEAKKLQRTKDVIYDIDKKKIKSIPALFYDKNRSRFTLKRLEAKGKSSTLKGLPLKHRQKTMRKKIRNRKVRSKKQESKETKKNNE